MNKKLAIEVSVLGQKLPPFSVDVTPNDSVENQLDKAIQIADLGDLKPGDGKLNILATVKVAGGMIKLPIELSFDVV